MWYVSHIYLPDAFQQMRAILPHHLGLKIIAYVGVAVHKVGMCVHICGLVKRERKAHIVKSKKPNKRSKEQ